MPENGQNLTKISTFEEPENKDEYSFSEQLHKDLLKASNKYSPEELIAVAATWVVKGHSKIVSRLTGVPAPTIRMWTRTQWWREMVRVIRKSRQEELDALYTGI